MKNKKIYIFKVLIAVIILTCCSELLIAQQTTDTEKWRQEDTSRLDKYLDYCRKEKASNPQDVYHTNPEYIVYTPKIEPEKLGDTYNDHFQVFNKPDGAHFVVWTQATIEGALDQHIVFSRSTDKGKTWSQPKVIAGSPTLNSGTPIASWGLPLVSKSGRIYIIYNQYVGKSSWLRQHTGLMTGIYSDDDGETWSAPQTIPMPRTTNDHSDQSIPAEWVIWQKPLRLAENNKYIVGMTRYLNPKLHYIYQTVVEFLRFENIDENPEVRDIRIAYFMNNDKVMHYGKRCEEPAMVKLPDKRLFTLFRTDSGFPVWSVSDENGENWSIPKPLLDKSGKPYPHPLSPSPLFDWKGPEAASGLYFAMIHNTSPLPKTPGYPRGPLYMITGRYVPNAEQPIEFGEPQLFIDRPFVRPYGNSLYASTTVIDGKLVLWYPDQKYYLLGKTIDEKWFKGIDKSSQSPVSLIFDTDMGPDYDDVGALTMLHAMADNGEVNILATMSSNQDSLVAPCIDVINTYFGRPDIPIGTPVGTGVKIGDEWHKDRWTDTLVTCFPHKIQPTDKLPDAVRIYRKILASQPDTSVVVATVGFLTNLANLLESRPDEFSSLNGKQLVKKKVKHLIAMAGQFPEGREWNIFCDSTSSQKVTKGWPTPIFFSGWEIGTEIRTGKRLVASNIKHTPAKAAYTVCLRQGDYKGRQSWDQTVSLIAVRGITNYFNLVRGRIKVAKDGSNTWKDDPKGTHYYLTFKKPKEELKTTIEELMMYERK